MRKVVAIAVFLGVTSPAVAQAPGQWYRCYFTPPKGYRTYNGFKVGKRYFVDLCRTSSDTAYYSAVTKFSENVYKSTVVAEPECAATHHSCVP